ncbi:MAG TPA: hypothetical protein VI895_10860 [Bdellovibrionota bacterium]|nr:hypothetical protein [Bdellovibrionota bacterium]
MNKSTIEKVVRILIEEEGGDWVLLGGSLARLEFGGRRATLDIELFSCDGKPESRLQLLRTAEKVGLPVEALNSAADFFLYRVPKWKEELILVRKGRRGRLYRPSKTLFCALKLSRGTDADIEDCEVALRAPGADVVEPRKLKNWLARLKVKLNAPAMKFLSKMCKQED